MDGAVATIRLDRPKMNALSIQLQAELGAAAAAVSSRSDIRAVVIYGGPRIFAAGADIKEMEAMSVGQMAAQATRLQDAFIALARIPKPTIAAVTGFALGGGLELALTADFRVLGDTARVGQPEIQLGVIPGAGGTQRLSRLIGPSKAKELIFSGRHVRADEALALGIADKVVPADDVYDEALNWARQYAERACSRAGRGESRHRRRAGDEPGRGAAAGVGPVRGPVRHRRQGRRDEELRRAGSGPRHVHRQLSGA